MLTWRASAVHVDMSSVVGWLKSLSLLAVPDLATMRFSRGRLEGRALEHGFVAWVRSRGNATDVRRAKKIRMLTPTGLVELVGDSAILKRMQRVACTLLPTLRSEVGFRTMFADQTLKHNTRRGRGNAINVDLRGKLRQRETWLEVKWTRGCLESALGKALAKASELETVAADLAEWALDGNLGGQRTTKPSYVGGLALSPSGWLLQVGDERWTGSFLDLCGFFQDSNVLASSTCNKYRRYNKSEAGKKRTRKYSQRPRRLQLKRTYQEEYARTARGRELRAAARQRYKDKHKV